MSQGQDAMSRRKSKYLAMFMVWIFAVVIVVLTFRSSDVQLDIRTLRSSISVLLVLAVVGNLAATAFMNHHLLIHLDPTIRKSESITTTTVASALNLIAPLRPGAVLRSVYFKRVHGISFTEFGATLVVGLAASGVAASVGLMAGAVMMLRDGESPSGWLILTVLPILAAVLVLFVTSRMRSQGMTSGLRSRLAAFADAVYSLISDVRRGSILIALGIGQVATVVLGLGASIALLGGQAHAPAVLIVGSLGVMAIFVSITPGGLGVYELAIAIGGTVVGNSLALFLAAAILQRAVGVLVTVVVASGSWHHLRRSPDWPEDWTFQAALRARVGVRDVNEAIDD